MSARDDLTKKQGIVVLDMNRGRSGDPVSRSQAEPLTLEAIKSAWDRLADTRGVGNLDVGTVGEIAERVHNQLIGWTALKL